MSTVAISASDVNKLRQMTGAGMMDCKKALTEANGDFEAAIDLLRKKGQKIAANRQDREAKEGYVFGKLAADGTYGAVVAVAAKPTSWPTTPTSSSSVNRSSISL